MHTRLWTPQRQNSHRSHRRQPGNSSSNHKHLIVFKYHDLSKTDIEVLAPIFAPPPPLPTSPVSILYTLQSSATSIYETNVRRQIDELPSHLRAKPFWSVLTTFCSVHGKLNPLPVTGLLDSLQGEADPRALKHLREMDTDESLLESSYLECLEDINAMWMDREGFREVFGRWPRGEWVRFQNTRCAACRLAAIGCSVGALIALGACVISKVNPRFWKHSRRIQFLEELIKVCVELKEHAERAVMAMWHLGVKMREIRKAAGTKSHSSREYIESYAERVAAKEKELERRERGGTTPVRPRRYLEQEDHAAVANEVLQQPDEPQEEHLSTQLDSATQSLFQSRTQHAQPAMQALNYSAAGLNNPFLDDMDDDGEPPPIPPRCGRRIHRENYSNTSLVPEPLKARSAKLSAVPDDIQESFDEGFNGIEAAGWMTSRRIPLASSLCSRRQSARVTIGYSRQSAVFSENELIESYRDAEEDLRNEESFD